MFVSHSSVDSAVAAQLHGWFTVAGHDVFLDRDLRDGIHVGDEWERRLHERLRWADAVVCIVTAAYRASTWCSAEVGIARSRGSVLLPVRAEPDIDHPLMPVLQWVDLTADADEARARLLEAVKRVDRAGGRGWPDGRSPFPGLRAFDLDLRQAFFGRDDDADRLAALLRSPARRVDDTAVLVVGPSGCGKSSLVRAGLVPVMTDEPGWSVLPPIVPGADPAAALARELAAAARHARLPWTPVEIRERLRRDNPNGLADVADDLLLAAPGRHRTALLVVVDQLEELVTQTPPDARAAFAGLLAAAAAGPVRVVATMRPEFLAGFLADPALAALATHTYTLRTLGRENLRAVVEGPAELAGLRVSDELVARLVDDTGSGAALPLLAFTLARLADGVDRGGELSLARYEQLGGVQGALVAQADAALGDAVAAGGRTPEGVTSALLRLVTVDEQGRPTRWRVARDELSEPARAELDAFVARRLLVSDLDGDVPVVEVAHEEFLTAWPPLAAAITDRAAGLRARRDIAFAADEWVAAGRPVDHLWEGGRLAAAVAATGADRPPPARSVDLAPTSAEFLRASRRHDTFRRRRLVGVLSVLLVAALVAAGVAYVQGASARQQLATATARQLLAQAGAVLASDPQTALRLGIAARHIDDSGETRSWLDSALTTTPYAGQLVEASADQAWSLAVSPDGRTLAVGHLSLQQARINLWDLTDPAGPRPLGDGLPVPGRRPTVTFSADGARLFSASDDSGITIWDVADRTRPRLIGEPVPAVEAGFGAVAFSRSGALLAVGSGPAVQLWSLADDVPRRLGAPLTGHDSDVGALAFSPDERTLAVVSAFERPVLLWDVTEPERPVVLAQPAVYRATVENFGSAAFSADGRTLALGGDARGAELWDVANPRDPRPIGERITAAGRIVQVAFVPGSGELVTFGGSLERRTYLWDVTDKAAPRATAALAGADGLAVAFTPDGTTMAMGGADGVPVELWTLRGHARPQVLGNPLNGHAGGVPVVRFSPDGSLLATGGQDRAVLLWDVRDPRRTSRLGDLTGHPYEITSLAFAPDGRTLAVVSSTSGGAEFFLWDVSDPRQAHQLGEPLTSTLGGSWSTVTFSRDGTTLSIGTFPPTFFDVRDPARPHRIGELAVEQRAVDFHVTADGRTLAVLDGTDENDNQESVPEVRVWDVTDPLAARPLGPGLRGLDLDPYHSALTATGNRLVISAYTVALVWDLTDPLRPVRLGGSLVAHDGTEVAGFDIALDDAGDLLATAGFDGTVVLWSLADPARPRALGPALDAHSEAILDVAFSPDQRTLVTTGFDGSVILWDLGPLRDLLAETVARACVVTGGGLDPDEWARYLPDREYVDTCAP